MPNRTAQPLSPLQKKILLLIGNHQELRSDHLAELLRDYCLRMYHPSGWQAEIELQCRLFSLRGVLDVIAAPDGSTLYRASPRLLAWVPRPISPKRQKRTRSLFKRWGLPIGFVASSFALAGCSSMMWPRSGSDAAPVTAVRPAQLPRYNPEGWLPPERMEQFNTPGKGAVYRFCTHDCPLPSPKQPLNSPLASSYEATRIENRGGSPDTLTALRQEAAIESVVAEAEAFLRAHPNPATVAKNNAAAWSPVKADQDARERQAHKAGSSTDTPGMVKNQAPGPKLPGAPANQPAKDITPSVSARDTAQPAPSKAKIPFSSNHVSLNETSRKVLGEMAEASQSAKTILLRGYASDATSEDEHYKISIARALAVRSALVESGVAKDKVRILYPKYPSPESTSRPQANSVAIMLVGKVKADHQS